METKINEIADGIYRLSTYVPDIAPPAGFTFNQFLVAADEPLLFHCGPRQMFPLVSEAAASADVLIPMMTRLDVVLIRSTSARLIQQWGAGLEGVDVAAASERGEAV